MPPEVEVKRFSLEDAKVRIAELATSLESNVPGYSGILHSIHKEFQSQPELLYKLSDPEIATVIAGLGKLHQIEVQTPRDKKPISKKQGSLMSEDDV